MKKRHWLAAGLTTVLDLVLAVLGTLDVLPWGYAIAAMVLATAIIGGTAWWLARPVDDGGTALARGKYAGKVDIKGAKSTADSILDGTFGGDVKLRKIKHRPKG